MNYKRSESKQAAKEEFRGLWAAATTPFYDNGEIDEIGLRKNLQYMFNVLNIRGIFCGGIVGEYWALTNEERMRVIKICVEESKNNNALVIAHTGDNCAKDAVKMTRYAEEVGADYAILITPTYAATDEMVYEWFDYVAKRINIGFWLFDTSWTGRMLSPELYAKLNEKHENFCGLKLGRGPEVYKKVENALKGSIVISDSNEEALIDRIEDHNMQVYQSSQMPFILQTANSQMMNEYSSLAWEGKIEEAREVSKKMEPIRDVARKWFGKPWNEHNHINIPAMKAWSELLGMAGGPVRPPMISLTKDEKEELKQDLISAGLL